MAVGRCRWLLIRCGDCDCGDVDPETEPMLRWQSCWMFSASPLRHPFALSEVDADVVGEVGLFFATENRMQFSNYSHCTPLLINEGLRVVRRCPRNNRRVCVSTLRLAPHRRSLEMLWLCYMRTLA